MPKKHENSEEIAGILGPKLRAARLSRGLKQLEVANQLSCNAEYYGRLERGHGLPSAEMLITLLDVLDLGADELLGEAIEVCPPISQLETLSPTRRRLADSIIAQGYEFVRLSLRILDYCAMREEAELEASLRAHDPTWDPEGPPGTSTQ